MNNILLEIYRSRIPLTLTAILFFGLYSEARSNVKRQDHKINISARNIPLSKVFESIKEQTGLTVNNNSNETELDNQKIVAVNFKQADINSVMSFLLNDYGDLTFLIKRNSIIIVKSSNLLKRGIISVNYGDTTSTHLPITGKVIDVSGNPIPGASVRVKGTSHATISTADGTFHFPEIEKGSMIAISSIGYETMEVTADGEKLLVKLKEHINSLDEKVVIAYGSTTKRFNTGNISSVKAVEIEQQPVSNVLSALQGRVPGLDIQQLSGVPGGAFSIHIQGINSLRNGNDPFFVIDGVPYVSQLLPTSNLIGGFSGINGMTIPGNPLNFLNSQDIESIEILKDADATAIYGSRAANGAVLITTRKGKPGNTKVDVTLQSGWGQVGHMLNLLNTKDYLQMRREALKNNGITTPSQSDWDLNGFWDSTRNVNWQKELIGKTASYTTAQLSISGGTQLTQFFVSGGYNKETTVYPGEFSDTKGSGHFNLSNSSPNRKFRTSMSASYMFDINRLPTTDLTLRAIQLAPDAPTPFLPNGQLNWQPTAAGSTTYYINPFASQYAISRNKTNNLTSNFVISYDVLPGLEIKSSLGYNTLMTNELTLLPLTGIYPENQRYVTRSSTLINNQINSWQIEPYVNYNRSIWKGKLTFLIGANISQQNSNQSYIAANGFNNDLVMEDLKSATTFRASSINSVYKYNAIYSRATYNLMEKYIINLTGRRDGSSRFGPENQFHNFGSVAGAWIFSQEQFIQNSLPFLSFGKIRGSYGTTGNDQIGDYQYLDLYQSMTVFGRPYQDAIGLLPVSLNNPYLQWEETRKLQFGIELGVLKDRVLVTANYNNNRSSNQLIPYSLPIIAGFESVIKNLPAVVQNTGWEFTINTMNIKTRNFMWNTSFNLTIPKNKLLSFKGADSYNSIEVGQSLSMRRVFQYIGVNDTTGNYQFKDAKGNIVDHPSDPTDKTVIINSDPKFYGGLLNTLSYKSITIDFLFQFRKQVGLDNLTYGVLGLYYPGVFSLGRSNQSTAVLDRWQKSGDKSTHQPFGSNFSREIRTIGNSDAVWTDASFIKLRNISITWQIPDQWKKSMHIDNLRIFMRAQNLFTLTRYKGGYDPEVAGRLGLPPLRVITFGGQITL
ncbi:SusC/RagA family TonB-linked outer membrane protein [Chitinophaga polysaccharea]|uniref:SusC/RagA family TonB-linked outer membrane protein n=1 Tax=Chitinophaga polysaccharea TaxID=1293035 RepID=UPI001455A01C|nr:SusC/RagA family TonB-linked outer membrane protein [Chitinophaga polysaccharea]NLR62305.1 SusC/RagA family TonB-linked outer membrane protein [Chitinophaga polysaccharea]